MILSWTTSKTVVSRIMRNIKGVEADYMEDIPEWIAEGIRKMKTKYSLQLTFKDLLVEFHQAKLNCPGESLVCIEHCGHKLTYRNEMGESKRGPFGSDNDFLTLLFRSQAPVYSTAGDPIQSLDDYEGGNPFPRDILVGLYDLPWDEGNWYNINYNKVQTSLKEGVIRVWYMALPVDEDNFPMIPDDEHYQEALYWYCRMMLIGAGFEDKVFNYQMAQSEWEHKSGRAISSITYPTPDQVMDQVYRHLTIFPDEYNWAWGDFR